jgi:uncharacterized protein with PIN domain
MELIPDDPIVSSLLSTGSPPWVRQKAPICPICGAECEDIYRDAFSQIVGCDECLDRKDAWETPECFPGMECH